MKMETVKFEELGLYPQLLRAIKEMGFEEATPIQSQAIPVVMSGVDVIGQAQTGTGKTAEENYEILKDGLCASKLFHKAVGNVDSYLDEKKMPGRLAWSEESHKRKYENDWVVDILPANDEYELGYDYHECGVCKL